MTSREAEKIINSLGGAIAREDGIARKQSFLPCSIPKIKQAYFIYLEELHKLNILTKDTAEKLVITYSMLDSFIDDTEAEKINAIQKKIKRKEIDFNNPEEKKTTDGYFAFASTKLFSPILSDEIKKFISELIKKD